MREDVISEAIGTAASFFFLFYLSLYLLATLAGKGAAPIVGQLLCAGVTSLGVSRHAPGPGREEWGTWLLRLRRMGVCVELLLMRGLATARCRPTLK